MTNQPHIEIILTHPDAEEAAHQLFDFGVGGVEFLDASTIRAFLNTSSCSLEQFRQLLIDTQFTLESTQTIPDTNWVQVCPELMEPLTIGSLTIKPVADGDDFNPTNSRICNSNAASASEIFIVPGMGFGTGHHGSTKIALTLLEQIISNKRISPLRSVLDVGSGSGILALAVPKLIELAGGHAQVEVIAIENDQAAVANSLENIGLNRLQKQIEVIHGEFPTALATTCQFDLIMANLYAELQCEFESRFYSLIRPGGALIVSGIMGVNAEQVRAAYKNARWQFLAELSYSQGSGVTTPYSSNAAEPTVESWYGAVLQVPVQPLT